MRSTRARNGQVASGLALGLLAGYLGALLRPRRPSDYACDYVAPRPSGEPDISLDVIDVLPHQTQPSTVTRAR